MCKSVVLVNVHALNVVVVKLVLGLVCGTLSVFAAVRYQVDDVRVSLAATFALYFLEVAWVPFILGGGFLLWLFLNVLYRLCDTV